MSTRWVRIAQGINANGLPMMVSVLYMFTTCVKLPDETMISPGLIPHLFKPSGFPRVWRAFNLLRSATDCLVITAGVVVLLLGWVRLAA